MSLWAAALHFLLASADARGAGPPRELTCLARYYRVRPVFESAWYAQLPDGARIPWSDGKEKSFEQRLANPDCKDVFVIPYRAGPIRPVDEIDEDPGRIRVEAILAATYASRGDAAVEQVRVRFLDQPVRVHRQVAAPLARVAERLERARRADPRLAPFLRRLSGGFSARTIAGTDRTSAHAFGIAVDLDVGVSDYWRWQRQGPHHWRNRIPQAIVDAFEAEGFIWGGRWYHYDTMHFEYRPELLDGDCSGEVRAAADSPARRSGAVTPPENATRE